MSTATEYPGLVTLADIKVHQHHLEILHRVDQYEFHTKVYYPAIDLYALPNLYDEKLLAKVYAHIALSETFKYYSLFPRQIDLQLIAKHLCKETIEFFITTYQHAYAQCQYENQIGNEYNPTIITGELLADTDSTSSIANPKKTRDAKYAGNKILVGNGGGKDSFLAMKILEESHQPYSSYQWTRQEYGRSQYQHQLCAKLLQHAKPEGVYKVSVFDDFSEGPFIQTYYPHLKGAFTLGIPECIFEALPIMLAEGHTSLCFANEKSSDTGNLYWDGIEREVNHQWVKSFEAEIHFQTYINQHLLNDFEFFSILKPIYDFRIFQHISRYPEFVKSSHSCNVDKPWCKKCPKCAYVWLGYLAHFPKHLVDEIFGANPFDDEDLIVHYKNMTGIEGHRSFECIGNIEECQLFMKKCLEKGLKGKMLAIFRDEIIEREINWTHIEEKYNTVSQQHNIPKHYFEKFKTIL